MNLVDVLIVLLALGFAVLGWERGLVASALPLVGFVAGAALGARLGPELLADGAESEWAPLVTVASGMLAGAFLAVALEGAGRLLRARIRAIGPAAVLDGAGGAILLAGLALLMAWAFGAVALHSTNSEARGIREAVQRSTILAALNEALPPSGPLLNVLRRVDVTPQVEGPRADVPAPDPAIADDPDVRAAAAGAVRVLGTACGLGVSGSGWVAAPELVVTNAHVVAGQDDTQVAGAAGSALDAEPVHYDPRNDLALLSVPGLGLEPLALEPDPATGADAAVIGFPESGPLTITPARLGGTGEVTSQDSYGRGPVQRSMTPFRAEVRSGNSGGPVVGAGGEVLATVFAASVGERHAGGLGVPNEVVGEALEGRLRPADTGACAA